MTTKAATANDLSKRDAKYQALIGDYLRQIREVRSEMQRSKVEIDRLKVTSSRKLAEIGAILNRAEAPI